MITFIRPRLTTHPFDEWATALVDELVKRNMAVPGVRVQLREYGSGAQRMRMVESVEGDDFVVKFGRKQETLQGGHWNDTAAVDRMAFGQKSLQVYTDCAPRLTTYAGKAWEADRYAFMHEWYFHDTRRPDYPFDYVQEIAGGTVFEHFSGLMQALVLRVRQTPVAEQQIDPAIEPPVIPVPEKPFGNHAIMAQVEGSDLRRIDMNRRNDKYLTDAERYALHPSPRLLHLGDGRYSDGFNSLAWDGFLWCYVDGLSDHDLPPEAARMERMSRGDGGVVKVRLNRANDVWVIDQQVYDDARAAVWAALPKGRDRLTSAEVSVFTVARARTLIELTEYCRLGLSYVRPLVLIRRELDLDEVEIVYRAEARRRA